MDNLIHILHLEDDALDAELIRVKIESAGIVCQINRVQNRDEFSQALRQGEYDIVLGDYRLPTYDGISALQLTRELRPDLPFIFVSGTLGEDAAISSFTHGATDYVLKQKLSRLVPAVKRALSEVENRRERQRAEEALHESKERIRRITENAKDMIYRMSLPDGKYEYVSPAATEITGYTPDEWYANPLLITKMIHPNWSQYFEEQWNNLLGGNVPSSYEYQILHKLGGVRWINQRNVLIYNREGTPIAIEGIATDVTERKQAEMQLLASEQLFRALVENSPDFIARYDREYRRSYVNPAIQQLFRGLTENVLGETPANQSPVYAPQVYIDHLRQVFETATESAVEMPFRTTQGEMHWGHMRFVPEFGPGGKVASVLAIGRDIHEIKENERRFRTLAENFPDFVVRFDRDGRTVYVNPAVEKAFDLPAEAIVGKTLHELPRRSTPEQNDTLVTLIRRAFDEGVTNEAEARWHTTAGERIFEIRQVPEKDATGNVVTILSVAHDITEIKRAEQERLAHLHFFESMDRVNRAMHGTNDLEQMMSDVLDAVLSIFDCDRAFLMYPCDPEATSWRVPMERHKPEHPGVFTLGIDVPMDPVVAETLRILLDSDGPVKFGPGAEHPLPTDVAERFDLKSFVSMALHPKMDKPWQFGLQQCSYARVWTREEERLLQEIGRRLADDLTGLLTYRGLQESEAKFSTAFRSSPSALSVSSAKDHVYLDANDVFLQWTGYRRAEVIGSTSVALQLWAEPEQDREFRRLLYEHGRVHNFEYAYRRKDGAVRYALVSATLIPLGGELCVLAQANDITERKRAEARILRLNRLYATLSQINQTIIHVRDQATLFQEICRVAVEYGQFRLVCISLIDEATQQVEPVAFAGKEQGYLSTVHITSQDELLGRGPTGTAIREGRCVICQDIATDSRMLPWREAALQRGYRSSAAVPIRQHERVIGALTVFAAEPQGFDAEDEQLLDEIGQDISFALDALEQEAQRRQAEAELSQLNAELEQRVIDRTAELARAHEHLRAILDTAGEGVVFTDVQGTIEYINPAMERLTGYTATEALGRNPRLWKSEQTPALTHQRMWSALTRGEIWAGELINRRKDGGPYNAALTVAPLSDSAGHIVGFVGVQRDITHQKELDRSKDQFVSNVSHELRTPLANILLHLGLLAEGRPDRRDVYLQTLRREAERLRQMIEDLLDLSRLDRDVAPIQLAPIDLNQLLEHLVTDREALAEQRGLTLTYEPTPELPPVLTDASHLIQVASNLMTNALNYTPTGGAVSVWAEVRRQEGQPMVAFTVRDTGPGIAAQDLPHLFERFYRGAAGRQASAPGTGLGLAISQEIMKRLGGRITVESEIGQGAAFTVWLPMS